jgi:hypothetical protein
VYDGPVLVSSASDNRHAAFLQSPAHRAQTGETRSLVIVRAMRRIAQRDDADLVQRQRRFGRFAGAKVAVMNRVESAAQHAEADVRCSCLATDARARRRLRIRSAVSG